MPRILSVVVILVLAIATLVGADGPPAPGAAGETGPVGQPGSAGGIGSLGPMLLLPLVFAFMYFIVIRPQRREEKKRKELIDAVKRGDKVVTIGGLHGEVVAVGETTIDVQAGIDGRETVLRFNKGAIASAGDTAKGK